MAAWLSPFLKGDLGDRSPCLPQTVMITFTYCIGFISVLYDIIHIKSGAWGLARVTA